MTSFHVPRAITTAACVAALAAAVACGSPQGAPLDSGVADTTPSPRVEGLYRFDPEELSVGDTALGMRVAAVNIERVLEGEMSFIGTVRFEGEVTLAGRVVPHPDYPDVSAPCFEPDSVTARRLPRFPADERRVWFCFRNPDLARRELGDPDQPRRATIVVSDYQTQRNFTDSVDEVQLVRVESRSP